MTCRFLAYVLCIVRMLFIEMGNRGKEATEGQEGREKGEDRTGLPLLVRRLPSLSLPNTPSHSNYLTLT